jgi:hypothetical protein
MRTTVEKLLGVNLSLARKKILTMDEEELEEEKKRLEKGLRKLNKLEKEKKLNDKETMQILFGKYCEKKMPGEYERIINSPEFNAFLKKPGERKLFGFAPLEKTIPASAAVSEEENICAVLENEQKQAALEIKKKQNDEEIPWEEIDPLLGTMADRKLAARFDVPFYEVRNRRKGKNIQSKIYKRRPA